VSRQQAPSRPTVSWRRKPPPLGTATWTCSGCCPSSSWWWGTG